MFIKSVLRKIINNPSRASWRTILIVPKDLISEKIWIRVKKTARFFHFWLKINAIYCQAIKIRLSFYCFS